MNIYKLSKIGTFHTNYNEDAFTTNELGNNNFLLAVMDGCSMGKESHFASTLVAKLLRKTAKEIAFKSFVEKTKQPVDVLLKVILEKVFLDLQNLKNQLLLETEELLCTLILAVINQKSKKAKLITIGDGLICYNGRLVEYEQDDKPDYLGYHLNENFHSWFNSQTQFLTLNNVYDLSLSTDGIFSFKPFNLQNYADISDDELVRSLLIDKYWIEQENMLDKKLSEIALKYGLKPSDDLTILRIVIC